MTSRSIRNTIVDVARGLINETYDRGERLPPEVGCWSYVSIRSHVDDNGRLVILLGTDCLPVAWLLPILGALPPGGSIGILGTSLALEVSGVWCPVCGHQTTETDLRRHGWCVDCHGRRQTVTVTVAEHKTGDRMLAAGEYTVEAPAHYDLDGITSEDILFDNEIKIIR